MCTIAYDTGGLTGNSSTEILWQTLSTSFSMGALHSFSTFT